ITTRFNTINFRSPSESRRIRYSCPNTFCSGPTTATFTKSSGSYLSLNAFQNSTGARSGITQLSMEFIANSPNGLLAYMGTATSDFLTVYLQDGKVNVEFNMIGTDVASARRNTSLTYNDRRWHRVTVNRGLGTNDNNCVQMIVGSEIVPTTCFTKPGQLMDNSPGCIFD
ncbi:hypothetical protein TrispH2_003109, partial [Trichoplax sp. H2]